MWPMIISVAGAIGALALFVIQLISNRKQKFLGIKKNRSIRIWNAAPSLIAFLCFLFVSISFYYNNGTSASIFSGKHELAKQVDSLSALVNAAQSRQSSEEAKYLKREGDLTSALKSKITNAYTLSTPVNRIDTIVVVVRDTANEKRLKGRLERMQLKNFELLKTIDSLHTVNAANEKEEK
jgi:hypothetical protein